jgi:hypothetical protein
MLGEVLQDRSTILLFPFEDTSRNEDDLPDLILHPLLPTILPLVLLSSYDPTLILLLLRMDIGEGPYDDLLPEFIFFPVRFFPSSANQIDLLLSLFGEIILLLKL